MYDGFGFSFFLLVEINSTTSYFIEKKNLDRELSSPAVVQWQVNYYIKCDYATCDPLVI